MGRRQRNQGREIGHPLTIIVSYNFGIREYTPFNAERREIFKGCPEMKEGYFWVNEKPGWGVRIDEKLATRFTFTDGANHLNGGWGEIRKRV